MVPRGQHNLDPCCAGLNHVGLRVELKIDKYYSLLIILGLLAGLECPV